MFVKIFTDGAARGNPDGPGGYGTIRNISTAKVCCMSGNTARDMYGRPTTAWN